MDLLNMLFGAMASKESIEALTKVTGADAEKAQKLVVSSLPLMLGSMTGNASSEEGARNLAGALKLSQEFASPWKSEASCLRSA